MTDTHALADQKVTEGVWAALRRQFGPDGEVILVSDDGDSPAVFGFQVDGVDYSLSVNRTP